MVAVDVQVAVVVPIVLTMQQEVAVLGVLQAVQRVAKQTVRVAVSMAVILFVVVNVITHVEVHVLMFLRVQNVLHVHGRVLLIVMVLALWHVVQVVNHNAFMVLNNILNYGKRKETPRIANETRIFQERGKENATDNRGYCVF